MYTKQKLGRELKEILTKEPFDCDKIAAWAQHIHYSYSLELSDEVYDIVQTLAAMCMGSQFEYTKVELLVLANFLISNEENVLEKLRILISE